MKVSETELKAHDIFFRDGDTFKSGVKLRRGQYFDVITSLEVLRSGIYVNGKLVCMTDLVDEINDFRIKNIRLCWNANQVIGFYEGKTQVADEAELVLLAFECNGQGTLPLIEGEKGVSLLDTHKKYLDQVRYQLGQDAKGKFILIDVVTIEHWYIQWAFHGETAPGAAEVHRAVTSILPGLGGMPFNIFYYLTLQAKLIVGDTDHRLWEYLNVDNVSGFGRNYPIAGGQTLLGQLPS